MIRTYLSFFLFITILWSCNQDEPAVGDTLPTELRESVVASPKFIEQPWTYDNLKGCYNSFVRDDKPSFNERFGIESFRTIHFEHDDQISLIVPLFKGEVMENFFWLSEDSYFLISREEEFKNKETERPYNSLFKVRKQDFERGDFSLNKSLTITGRTRDYISITSRSGTPTPETVYGRAINFQPCSKWEDEWIEIYLEFLGIPIPIDPEIPPAIPLDIMNQIIVSVTGGDCVCPLPCLIAQEILNSSLVTEEAKDQVRQNWVSTEYGLDITIVDLIETSLLNDLVAFDCRPTTITDPCTDERISQDDIVNAIFESFPFGTSEGFYSSLSETHDWIFETEAFKECELIKCLFDILREDADMFWCDIFDQFDNVFRDLVVDVGGDNFTPNPFVQNPARNGVTGLNNDGVLAITFNPELCDPENNTDILRVAKTILHEGVHADLWQYVSDNLLPGQTLSSIDQTTFNEVFDGLFHLVCEDSALTDQHQVMMNNSIELIASALHTLNDGIGEVEDYEYLAWLGIWRDDDCVESVISLEEINELRDRYEANVTLSPSITCG